MRYIAALVFLAGCAAQAPTVPGTPPVLDPTIQMVVDGVVYTGTSIGCAQIPKSDRLAALAGLDIAAQAAAMSDPTAALARLEKAKDNPAVQWIWHALASTNSTPSPTQTPVMTGVTSQAWYGYMHGALTVGISGCRVGLG